MFRKIRNKTAQHTAEYALLIAMVVAAVIAMTVYVQRAMQAKMRDTSLWFVEQTNAVTPTTGGGETTLQYHPYYDEQNFTVDQDRSTVRIFDKDTTDTENRAIDRYNYETDTTNRTGNRVETYDPASTGIRTGI